MNLFRCWRNRCSVVVHEVDYTNNGIAKISPDQKCTFKKLFAAGRVLKMALGLYNFHIHLVKFAIQLARPLNFILALMLSSTWKSFESYVVYQA